VSSPDIREGRAPGADALDRLYLEHVAELERRYAPTLCARGVDVLVIHSGSPAKRTTFDDQYWPLRPVPHWQHWLPLAEPDCALVLRPGRRPALLRKVEQSFWEKAPAPEASSFEDALDVHPFRAAGEARARAAIQGSERVAVVGEGAGLSTWAIDGARVNDAALLAALDALRVQKTPYEVACLVEANRRAHLGHALLHDLFRDGDASELELHLAYLRATAQDDWETPYKNIVALGPHAATLHHVAYGRLPAKREAESLLVDAGATCRGYGADVTRTWVKGRGAAAGVFEQLVAGTDAMQRRLCAAVRVGAPYEDLHDDAHRQAAAVLREVGVVTTSVDEAVALGITRTFFPHGLGHSLGLQTHDVGCGMRAPRPQNAFLRNTTDVAVAQVFTIEPGLYFIAELLEALRASPAGAGVDWSLVGTLAPLGGVRVEDDLHVVGGEAVVRNLTRECLPSGGGRVD
jgi:Xaa-Pro dipeptidase